MSHFATDADRAASPDHRAQVLADAVVSAYIDEIARSGRRQRRRRPVTQGDGTQARRRSQPGADEAPASPHGRARRLTAATVKRAVSGPTRLPSVSSAVTASR